MTALASVVCGLTDCLIKFSPAVANPLIISTPELTAPVRNSPGLLRNFSPRFETVFIVESTAPTAASRASPAVSF